jgi:hypothetical protein
MTEAFEFRRAIGNVLLQAQFGSKIGQPPIRRRPIIKLIEEKAKRRGLDPGETDAQNSHPTREDRHKDSHEQGA